MKILITSDLYPPVLNGVATFAHNLAKGMVARGHDVIVIAPSQTGKRYEEMLDGVKVYRPRAVIFPFYQNVRICVTPQLEVRKIIQEFQPDVIHNQMPLGIGQAATMVGKAYDMPIVSTSHAMPENLMENLKKLSAFSRPINYMLADFGRRYHSRSDVVTTPTESGLAGFSKHVAKIGSPLKVISNGINLKDFTPGKAPASIYKKYGLPTDKKIITTLSRIDAEKHIWVLLHAFKEVLEQEDAHLLIVGAGVDLENLKTIACDLGIDEHVTFTGRLPEEDKADIHRVGTLFAVASPVELQCIAALEAMASGQPVVAVEAGALGELCHDGKNGYRFGFDDYHGAAEAILKVLRDDALREKFSKESLAMARANDLEFTLDAFTKLYKSVIKSKQAEIAARPAGFVDRLKESELAEYFEFWSNEDDEAKSK